MNTDVGRDSLEPSGLRPHRTLALHARKVHHGKADLLRRPALRADSAALGLVGLPMHWMRVCPLPGLLYVERAQGIQRRCADAIVDADFCFGDPRAMYRHNSMPVAQAIAEQTLGRLTAMLPGCLSATVGALLPGPLRLPSWQLGFIDEVRA